MNKLEKAREALNILEHVVPLYNPEEDYDLYDFMKTIMSRVNLAMATLSAALESEEPDIGIDALTLAKQWFNNKEMPSLVTTLANDIQSYAEAYHAEKCEECTRVTFNNLGPKKFDI